MYVLDLFSGIGGFSLGLERAGFKTAAFCEINPFCRAVLKKHWPSVPCFDDVRTLSSESLAANAIPPIDIICGGYPCQPFSAAGKRRGQTDDRHLWPEMFRLIQELRPTWVVGENVAGHISMGLDDVLADLEAEGYTARAFVIPACAVDAPHRRDRVWVVAHTDNRLFDPQNALLTRRDASLLGCEALADADGERKLQPEGVDEEQWRRIGDCREAVADTQSGRWRQGHTHTGGHEERAGTAREWSGFAHGSWWPPEPDVGRVADGIPLRVDRTKSLGNGLVSDIPEAIGHAIAAIQKGWLA